MSFAGELRAPPAEITGDDPAARHAGRGARPHTAGSHHAPRLGQPRDRATGVPEPIVPGVRAQ